MYLVFDIGGTNIRIGVSSDTQSLTTTKSVLTMQNFEEGIEAIKNIAQVLSGGEQIQAVAGGIAGLLDKDKTMLIASAHISGWINKPLKNKLEEVFGVPTKLENDSLLGGLGEAVYGAGRGTNIVAYIAVGTGVGGARFVDGKIDQNSLGFEPGHQIIDLDGNECNCGGKGHLETYVGGFYLEKKYHKRAEEITDHKVWDEAAKYLAIGLNNTIVHWSPDIVILGGSVANKIPLDATQRYLSQFLTIFPTKPTLVKAQLDYPGLYGALELIKS
ncbi:MAG: ROK family protein [Candidatus Daviesbacteria bacterium]|nr:ROK family protein [Candidatus Daviesbacteria bacterium]